MNAPTPAPSTSSPAARAPVGPGPVPTRHGELSIRSVWWFFAATFAVTWGLGIVVMAFMDEIEAALGPIGYTNPVFVLMVYSPGFVALAMVWRHHGARGLVAFLRRLTLWRMSLGWWLLLVGMPVAFYAGAAVTGNITEFPFDPWYGVLPALIPAFLIGPIEELGWRGVALPLLQRRFAPLRSALIVGAVAALWHTPAFLMSGTKQSAWSFWPFFFGVVAISVIQPWDMLGFVVVALAVVVVNRPVMLTRGARATDVLLPAVAATERVAARS